MDVSELIAKGKYFTYKLFDIPIDEEISIIEEAEEQTVLPDDYLERFTLYPLQNVKSLKGRENEILNLERAYENWKITSQPLLIVSNPGEGTTSLLHSSTHIYPKAKIIETNKSIDSYSNLVKMLESVFGYQDCKHLNEIQNKVNESEENYVLIVENIERLFTRKINGFTLLEDFLLFLHATKDKIYWIASINKYSYYYLNSVKYFASHFPSVIKLNPIKPELLKEEVMLRNQGYDMVFLKPKKITKKLDGQLKKYDSDKRQEVLKELFFEKMISFSNGNITKCILYCRASAYDIKDKTLYIKPFELKSVDDLNLNDLFILEAIFQHRALTISELNLVLRNSNRQSRLSIENLLEKGLIREVKNTSKGKEYRIDLMYLDVLKDRLRERLNRNFR